MLGPFGEVVSYDDRLIYLTWYPEGLQAISTDLTPPEWSTYPPEPLRLACSKELFALSPTPFPCCATSRWTVFLKPA